MQTIKARKVANDRTARHKREPDGNEAWIVDLPVIALIPLHPSHLYFLHSYQ